MSLYFIHILILSTIRDSYMLLSTLSNKQIRTVRLKQGCYYWRSFQRIRSSNTTIRWLLHHWGSKSKKTSVARFLGLAILLRFWIFLKRSRYPHVSSTSSCLFFLQFFFLNIIFLNFSAELMLLIGDFRYKPT